MFKIFFKVDGSFSDIKKFEKIQESLYNNGMNWDFKLLRQDCEKSFLLVNFRIR